MHDGLRWHARPPRGCDVALRPRGRATGGPRGAQVAHRARTRGRRPRGSTRMPVRSATWQVRLAGKFIGAVTQMRTAPPHFKRDFLLFFFCVGLCSHTVLPVQDAWQPTGRRMRSGRLRYTT